MNDEGRVLRGELDAMMEKYTQLRASIDTMQAQVRQVQATAYSEDGVVVVTVGPQGHLLGIRIDPVVTDRPDTEELSASIMEAVTLAVSMAGEEVAAITAAHAPEGYDHDAVTNLDFSAMLAGADERVHGRG